MIMRMKCIKNIQFSKHAISMNKNTLNNKGVVYSRLFKKSEWQWTVKRETRIKDQLI